jgi:hypothetical protein
MAKVFHTGDISGLLQNGLQKARMKFLEEAAKNNRTVVVSDGKGNIKNVPAKELLHEAQKTLQKK